MFHIQVKSVRAMQLADNVGDLKVRLLFFEGDFLSRRGANV